MLLHLLHENHARFIFNIESAIYSRSPYKWICQFLFIELALHIKYAIHFLPQSLQLQPKSTP